MNPKFNKQLIKKCLTEAEIYLSYLRFAKRNDMKSDATIYLVDDNDVTLLLLGQKIRKALHCKIRLFSSAKECLKALDKSIPQIIISDYRLKNENGEGMNGDRLLVEVKKEHPDLPVIIYSSRTNIDMELDMKRFGADSATSGGANLFDRITELVNSQLAVLEELSKKRKFAWGTFISLTILSGIFLFLSQHFQSKIMYLGTGILFAALVIRFYYLIKDSIPLS